MTRIIQFTTVHPRTDVRIRIKEVTTLSQHLDAQVDLFVQDGLGNEVDATHGFEIVDTGLRPKGRIARMTLGTWRMYRAVRAARPTIVHFHDPELIPAGLLLRLGGVKVVYDVHENLPRQILSKPYLQPQLRGIIAKCAAAIEWVAGQAFDGISVAAQSIYDRFPPHKTILLRNFALLEDISSQSAPKYATRPNHFTYVGGLTKVRGTQQMVDAIALTEDTTARLQLAGNFNPAAHQTSVEASPGWEKVDFHGWADRRKVADLLSESKAGLAVLQPTPTHIEGLPVKFFEYMAVGIPIIASNFPVWRDIIETIGCGLSVDPEDPKAIARAMDYIIAHPEEAEKMGLRGQKAVHETYNWPSEVAKLVTFYHEVLGVPLSTQPNINTPS